MCAERFTGWWLMATPGTGPTGVMWCSVRERLIPGAWPTSLRDECVDVVGLPSGASAAPQAAWLEFLRGRQVTLLFDG